MSLQPVDYTRGMPAAPDLIGAYGAGVRFRQGDRAQDMQQQGMQQQQAAQTRAQDMQQQAQARQQQQYDAGAGMRAEQLKGAQLGNQASQEKIDAFMEEKNLNSMVTGAQEYLSKPNPAAKERFLQERIKEIAARDGDFSETNEMLAASPEDREVMAQNVVKIGMERGLVQGPGGGSARKTQLIKSTDGDGKAIQQLVYADDGSVIKEFGGEFNKNDVMGVREVNNSLGNIRQISEPWRRISSAYDKIISLGDDASGQAATMILFMKTLDPDSAVLPGEMATIRDTRGVPASVRNYYNQIINGKPLGKKQKAELIDNAKGMRDKALISRNKRIKTVENEFEQGGKKLSDYLDSADPYWAREADKKKPKAKGAKPETKTKPVYDESNLSRDTRAERYTPQANAPKPRAVRAGERVVERKGKTTNQLMRVIISADGKVVGFAE